MENMKNKPNDTHITFKSEDLMSEHLLKSSTTVANNLNNLRLLEFAQVETAKPLSHSKFNKFNLKQFKQSKQTSLCKPKK